MKHYSQFIKTFALWVIGFFFFCLGIASGYVVFNPAVLTAQMQPKSPTPTQSAQSGETATSDKALVFRLDLQQREQEYVVLLYGLLKSNYEGTADASASATQVTANIDERAKIYGSYYGSETGESVMQLQRTYSNTFISYTNALKRNNRVGMDSALKQLIVTSASQSAMFNDANRDLPENGLNKLGTDSIMLMKEAIDAYAVQDYALAYSKEREGYTQAADIATTQSNAIVKKYPEKFR